MTHAKFSTNGTTWTTATFTTTVSGNFVNFENTSYRWGALTDTGQIWKNYQFSDNLGLFSISPSYPNGILQLSSLNNRFIAVLGSDYQASNNLENWNESLLWTTVTSNLGTSIQSVAYGNGLWIVGAYGGQIRTSTNGSDWTTVTSNFGNAGILSIAYGNGLWVVVGGVGQIRTSTNGSAWTTVTSNFGDVRIRSVAYGNGLWIAGGYGGQMRTSTNGSAWTTVTSNFGTAIIFPVAYGNGLWIAGGILGQMRTSTNGSTWTTVTSNFGTTVIFSIAYGNGLWIAGGSTGDMRTSTNGSTWTTVNSNFGNTTIRPIAHANGLWIAGGDTGQMRTSTQEQLNLNKFIKSQDKQKGVFLNNNGILFNWNGLSYDRISTGINDNFVNGAIRNNGGTYEYIIQGNNALYRSTNLTTWTTISVPPASDVNDIIAK